MTTAAAPLAAPPTKPPAAPPTGPEVSGTSGAVTRDPRLDFFRGLGMFIILISHVPGNTWSSWIPGRFGFSDAAEIFVFCSGMASAIAFGRVFDRAGWAIGTARVAFRVWQIYWAHICLFFAIAVTMSALNQTGWFEADYVKDLNLQWFFLDTRPGHDTTSQLIGLMTLTYVPNYFDILPMYIVILAMMPFVVALHRVSPRALFVALVALWIATQFGQRRLDGMWLADAIGLPGLPAEPWSERPWYFNPFGWQAVFYTGFALMRGWLPRPPVHGYLTALALVVVLGSVPLAWHEVRNEYPALRAVWESLAPLRDKTSEGLYRYLHIVALAYLAYVAAGEGGRNLVARGTGRGAALWTGVVAWVMRVGQQSLAIFLWSMWASRMMGVLIDISGGGALAIALVNLIGIASVLAVAWICAWFKAQPWKPRRPAR